MTFTLAPRHFLLFMLTHGEEVRKVSFFMISLKATRLAALRTWSWVSSTVIKGNSLTFMTVKNPINKVLINQCYKNY